jgi:hypothetical protein
LKYFVNDVKLANGDETVLHGSTSLVMVIRGHDGKVFDQIRHLDFVIEIGHNALLEMIEEASADETKKRSNGLVTIKVDNIEQH